MAVRLFTVDLDLGLNKAKRFIFEDFSTTPGDGSNAGRVIYWTAGDSAANHLKVYNGTSWKTLAYTDDVPDISISLDAPQAFTVSGSPAGASGTLEFNWVDVASNYVLAGPSASGQPAEPTFRALVDADIPVEIARVDDVNTSLEDYILLTEKGEPLGVAELDGSGFIPQSQIPNSLVVDTGITIGGNANDVAQDGYLGFNTSLGTNSGAIYSNSSGDLEITGFESTDIIIGSALGGEYLGSVTSANQIATIGDITAITTTVSGTTNEIEVTTTGTNDYIIGLPSTVRIEQLFVGPSSGGIPSAGELVIFDSSGTGRGRLTVDGSNDFIISNSSSDIVINATEGGEYLGSVTTNNQIATIGDIANAANTFSNVDGNLDITTSGTAVTIDLADNITLTNTITFEGAAPELEATTTGSAYVFDKNVGALYIGGESTATFIGSTTTGSVTIGNDLVVGGNLTVNGSTTTLNTETLVVEDNVIVLNSNATSPLADAGILVNRGIGENQPSLQWIESTDVWTVSNGGGTSHAIARKYVTTTTGTTHTITHNLGTSDVTVNCWVSGEQVEANVVVTDANTGTVTTNSSLTVKTVVVG